MQHEEIAAGVRTVTHLAAYFEELKRAAVALAERIPAEERGYFTPREEDELRAILVSYWHARGALLDLVSSLRRDLHLEDDDGPAAFLVALAAAAILVDAARFLRERFNDKPVARRKLNEAAPEFGIPPRSYDRVQRSLVGARHAWHLYHAISYFNRNEPMLRKLAASGPLEPVMAVLDRLRARLDVSAGQFARTRLRVRSGQIARRLARNLLGRAIYGLQKLSMGMAADVYVRPGHRPEIAPEIARRLDTVLRPGDVLIVRREYALTNYFLPGYWPHAAIYLGDANALDRLRAVGDRRVRRAARAPQTAGERDRCVLESTKDGVYVRSLASPLASDSLVVLRPRLSTDMIAEALARGLSHEGKPYDFDFDFTRSDRLVCTEVVYRSYEGIGPMRFRLKWRVGRPTLSGSDLTKMAIERVNFDPVVVFAPRLSPAMAVGEESRKLMRKACGMVERESFR